MNNARFDLAVIIPANNEEAYIGRCLGALLAQDATAGRIQIVVSANACTDRTVTIVEAHSEAALARGWELTCLDSPEPGKAGALNRADAVVDAPVRLYLDADIVCEPSLVGQLQQAVECPEPTYATGTLAVTPPQTWTTQAYSGFWKRLPFVRDGAVGAGLFAVNAAGRRRWDQFPSIISDDTFARLNFTPAERREVPARYYWPMVEGLGNLVRVRRRQDAGVAEVYRLYPALRPNEAKRSVGPGELAGLALRDPLGFAVYALVYLLVLAQPPATEWSRGR